MKYAALVFFMFVPLVGLCVSVEDIGRLAELETTDDLILQIIDKEGVNRPLNAKDVIYLKERGLSEGVIDYLWRQSYQDKGFLPPQEGESKMIGESLRTYSSIDKAGNKIVVLTNLDEDGRRMGPPPPPRMEPEAQPQVFYSEPPAQPIYVDARPPGPAWAFQEEDMQSYLPAPLPFSDYGGYYPFFSTISFIPARPIVPHCKPTMQRFEKINIHAPVVWPGQRFKLGKK
jgi:hypothetical protein